MYNMVNIINAAACYVGKLYREYILRILITRRKVFLLLSFCMYTRCWMFTELIEVIISGCMTLRVTVSCLLLLFLWFLQLRDFGRLPFQIVGNSTLFSVHLEWFIGYINNLWWFLCIDV